MRLEFLLIHKQVGPSKTEIIAKRSIFQRKISTNLENFQNKNHKKIYLKVGKCVYMREFFCADKKHTGQPKKKLWPPRPPLKVPQKLIFFTHLTFSSISIAIATLAYNLQPEKIS